MPDSIKTKKELRSKDQETTKKIKTLKELKQQYFNKGFTAKKEHQRYLALKIIEIEQEIKNLTMIKKSIATHLSGLDIIESKKGYFLPKITTQDAKPVSKNDLDRLYREWEHGKKKPEIFSQRKQPPTDPKPTNKKISYTFLTDPKAKTPNHTRQLASIRSIITASLPGSTEHSNPFLNHQNIPLPEQSDPSILNPYSTASMNDLNVGVQYAKKINMALVHNDIPIIDKITITNTSSKGIDNIMAGVWISPDYSDSFETSIHNIPPSSTKELDNINPPFSTGRLKIISETEKGMLRLELTDGTRKIFTESYPVEVMAYNDWYIGSNYKFAETIASFIFPNDPQESKPAVETIISHAVERLRSIAGTTAFDGYQSGDPKKVIAQAQAIFEAIQLDIGLTYINPPASFEFTGQKILSPGQIIEHRRGTCLDLTVLYAACLERVGIHPVVFMVQGHAFAGFWIVDGSGLYLGEQRAAKVPVFDAVREVVEKMYLVPVETTQVTDRKNSFSGAVGAWVRMDETGGMEFRLPDKSFHCMVDVYGCRLGGVRPMPV